MYLYLLVILAQGWRRWSGVLAFAPLYFFCSFLFSFFFRFYTKKTGAGGRLVKLPLASLATLITVHRNLRFVVASLCLSFCFLFFFLFFSLSFFSLLSSLSVDSEEQDKDGLKAKIDRVLQVVQLDPQVKKSITNMSDSRKWLFVKACIANGFTVDYESSGAVNDSPTSIASKLKSDPSLAILQLLEKCVKEKVKLLC
jgi:hypothetical protein